jgi:hypothetical protein
VQVVITIFWLGKAVRNSYRTATLDLSVFHNLVDAPATPLARSEVSLPSLSGTWSPIDRSVQMNDSFTSQVTSPASTPFMSDWQRYNSVNPDSMERSSVGDESLTHSSSGPASVKSDLYDGESTVPVTSAETRTTSGNNAVNPLDRRQLTRSVIEDSRQPHGSATASKSIPMQRQTSASSVKSTQVDSNPRPVSLRQPTRQQQQQQQEIGSTDNWEEVLLLELDINLSVILSFNC